MATVVRRSVRVMLRLDPRVGKSLYGYAEQMGMAPSALAAYAVGQWVMQQDATKQAMGHVVGFLEKQAVALGADGPKASLSGGGAPR